jgi:putative Ca2+/H+ antiporter (TMEM165/GDT1 family)
VVLPLALHHVVFQFNFLNQIIKVTCTMDLKMFAVVFGTVFLAELGDKTQLATVLFASRPSVSLVTVFIGASAALILSSVIAVAAGSLITNYLNPKYLSYIAGAGFVAIGIWTIWQASAQ